MPALSACGNSKELSANQYNDPRFRGPGVGRLSGGTLFTTAHSGSSDNGSDQGGALGVNAYLWRGALDTLSFMPLASADPFGGVIITDWYSAAGQQRRAVQGHCLYPWSSIARRRGSHNDFPANLAGRPMG